MDKIKITLYTSPECPLCEKAKGVISKAVRGKFEIREVDISGDEKLFEMFSDKVPVVEIAGRYRLYYPFTEEDVRACVFKAKEFEIGRKAYERNSRFYDFLESPMEIFAFSSLRKKLFNRIIPNLKPKSKVLEVGIGTGKNIPYYPDDVEIYGCDLSFGMLRKAKLRIEKLGKDVYLVNSDAQMLSFKDDVFDVVVTTFVFCSVVDPILGLSEIRRVLKPGGKLIMLEHVRADNPAVGKIMDIFDPLIFRIIGAHINRKTRENIEKAGFSVRERKIGGVVRIFEAVKNEV